MCREATKRGATMAPESTLNRHTAAAAARRMTTGEREEWSTGERESAQTASEKKKKKCLGESV